MSLTWAGLARRVWRVVRPTPATCPECLDPMRREWSEIPSYKVTAPQVWRWVCDCGHKGDWR